MWFRFSDEEAIGTCRVSNIQLCWYDMELDGRCFSESFFSVAPDSVATALTYVETIEDRFNSDRARVFVNFDNGDVYELKLHKMTKEQIEASCNFYGGCP